MVQSVGSFNEVSNRNIYPNNLSLLGKQKQRFNYGIKTGDPKVESSFNKSTTSNNNNTPLKRLFVRTVDNSNDRYCK